jgi:hypothetical protein
MKSTVSVQRRPRRPDAGRPLGIDLEVCARDRNLRDTGLAAIQGSVRANAGAACA